MCIFEGCKIRPSFNTEGNKPLYCFSHMSENMINVNNKNCIHKDCKLTAIYNKSGERPIYCSKHKTNDMINVISKNCIHKDCKIRATYNKKEKGLFIVVHIKRVI